MEDIKNIARRKTMLFNSTLATDKDEPEFTFQKQSVKNFQINSIKVPISYYNVYSTNNTIAWDFTGVGAGSSTLTTGIYDAEQLRAEMQTQLSTDTGLVVTVTKSSTTYNYTITCATNTFQITAGTTASDLIGFRSLPTALANSATGTIYNLIRTKYAMLYADGLRPFDDFSNNGEDLGNIIAFIPIEANRMAISLSQADFYDPVKVTFTRPFELKRLKFKLLDDNGAKLEFNGLGFSVEIVFNN